MLKLQAELTHIMVICTVKHTIKSVDIDGRLTDVISIPVDADLIRLCEHKSIRAVGCTTTEPALMGVDVRKDMVNIKFANIIPRGITLTLSGIKK